MSLGSKPKEPDTSKQDELMAKQRARMQKQDAEIAAELAAKRKRGKGRASLVSFSERGVQGSSKGATGAPTRTSLG